MLLALNAGVYIGVAPVHLKEMPGLGGLLTGGAVLGGAIAVALVSRPTDRRIAALAGLFCLAEILIWLLFVTSRVPFFPGTPVPVETIALVSTAIEVIGWAVALGALSSGEAPPLEPAGQTTTVGALTLDSARAQARDVAARARAYFADDGRRTIQTALGLLWLIDGGLQFQSFMYSHGFVQMMVSTASGQPGWLASMIRWGAHLAQHSLTVFNTMFAVTQVLIGMGLLYRPTVKLALTVSFAWMLVVWLVGEGLGMLFTNTASPLTGAPGAVLLYTIIGMVVWPGEREGGLLGVRRARMVWAILWLAMGWLWLLPANSSANATHNLITAAPSGASWLTGVQHAAAGAAQGVGLAIALILASLSAVIGVAVAINWRANTFLAVAIVLNLAYWVLGQGLGGILTGTATDPNAGPLFMLFALALYQLIPGDSAMPSQTTNLARRRAAAVTD